MNPDKFQQAWQADSAQTNVTIHAGLLLNEVQRSQRGFQSTINWRDCREVGAALLMVPYWFHLGISKSLPWTWYLTVPALIWVAGFIIVDRIRHPKRPSGPGEPLLFYVKEALHQVEHQVWLLRNVFWWYLLPPSISIMAFFVHVSWLSATAWWQFIVILLPFALFLFVVYGAIYYINQRAVRKDLEPRRQELLALLSSLSDEPHNTFGDQSNKASPGFASPHASERKATPFAISVTRKIALLIVVGLLVFAGPLLDLARRESASSDDGPPRTSGIASDSLARLVTEQRKQKNLVGLAAMVMVNGQVEGAAVQGQRKYGSGVPLELSDRWHLGGITKSITATMIARLIESGQMNWSDTVGDAFPEASTHEAWKRVTLKQLLTDTAGAPVQFPRALWSKQIPVVSERTQARREAVLDVIAKVPAYQPGKKNMYSNVGYTIAGAMAEKVTGATWEDLVIREVFEPLGLKDSGFGPPTSPDDSLPQPRGHRTGIAGKVAVDDDTDNSPIMGPAGSVHMTLSDLCTFATEHLRGELGEGTLLSAETYRLLHTPELDRYACGWIKNEPNADIPHAVYWHNGSNTLWYAMVAFIPATNKVVAITSNDGDMENAEAAALEVLKANWNVIYPKESPFAGVRWQDSQPEIKLGEEWLQLVSLNELAVSEIIAFSQHTYGDQWQKRFEEDLVELLTRFGYPPQDFVTLTVRSLDSNEESIRTEVPMTEENRKAIYAANRESQR